MLDITNDFGADTARDIKFEDTDAYKAKNILDVQLGYLWFAPDFGIDIAYYVLGDLQFQAETFNAYILGELIKRNIDIQRYESEIKDFVDKLVVVV